MTCSLLRPVVISLVAVASGAASGAPVDVIFTNIPGHPTAAAPGVEGAVFRHPLVPFLTLGGSADGERWIFKAFIDAPDTSNDVIVVGHGLTGAVVAREGDPAPEDGLLYGFMDSDCGINDSGQYAFGNRMTGGPTTSDECIIRFDGADHAIAVREGDAAPGLVDPPGVAGDELFGNSLNSTDITNDGVVTFHADLIENVDTNYRSAVYIGSTPVLQEGQSAETLLGGAQHDGFTALSGNTFTTSADGSAWIVESDIDPGIPSLEAVVLTGSIVLREGDAPPDLEENVDGIFAVNISGAGDWYVRGDTVNDTSFLMRNGAIVAAGGTPVPGSEGEAYDTFLAVTGRPDGSYAFAATTTFLRGGESAIIMLDNQTVIARTGDPVDLDGNGEADDDVVVGAFAANDLILSAGRAYFFASLDNGAGDDLGDAFLSVVLPADGVVGDLDGDGTVGPADLAILLAAWGPCPRCPEDLDGDGVVGPGDLAILLANWG